MSFPQSHTAAHPSWQFVLFAEINESFVDLLIEEPEEEPYEWNISTHYWEGRRDSKSRPRRQAGANTDDAQYTKCGTW